MLKQPITRRRAALRARAKRKTKAVLWSDLYLLLPLFVAGAVFTASFLLPPPSRYPRPTATPAPLLAAAQVTDTGVFNPQADVTVTRLNCRDVPLVLVSGGTVGTRRDARRQGVSQFVTDCGATAGVNGTFFADASLRGEDNTLIGPSLCGDEARMVAGPYDRRVELVGRPLVLLSPTRTRFLSYDPHTMDNDTTLRRELPGLTDAFLGGVWLVHDGVAVSRTGMARYHVHDANDPRRRAFFGLTPDGRPVLGATAWVTTSPMLAQALQRAGLREAILLDSGFSTSLVLKNKVLVTGHTAPGIPSRPVPHALMLFSPPRFARAKAASVKAMSLVGRA